MLSTGSLLAFDEKPGLGTRLAVAGGGAIAGSVAGYWAFKGCTRATGCGWRVVGFWSGLLVGQAAGVLSVVGSGDELEDDKAHIPLLTAGAGSALGMLVAHLIASDDDETGMTMSGAIAPRQINLAFSF